MKTKIGNLPTKALLTSLNDVKLPKKLEEINVMKDNTINRLQKEANVIYHDIKQELKASNNTFSNKNVVNQTLEKHNGSNVCNLLNSIVSPDDSMSDDKLGEKLKYLNFIRKAPEKAIAYLKLKEIYIDSLKSKEIKKLSKDKQDEVKSIIDHYSDILGLDKKMDVEKKLDIIQGYLEEYFTTTFPKEYAEEENSEQVKFLLFPQPNYKESKLLDKANISKKPQIDVEIEVVNGRKTVDHKYIGLHLNLRDAYKKAPPLKPAPGISVQDKYSRTNELSKSSDRDEIRELPKAYNAIGKLANFDLTNIQEVNQEEFNSLLKDDGLQNKELIQRLKHANIIDDEVSYKKLIQKAENGDAASKTQLVKLAMNFRYASGLVARQKKCSSDFREFLHSLKSSIESREIDNIESNEEIKVEKQASHSDKEQIFQEIENSQLNNEEKKILIDRFRSNYDGNSSEIIEALINEYTTIEYQPGPVRITKIPLGGSTSASQVEGKSAGMNGEQNLELNSQVEEEKEEFKSDYRDIQAVISRNITNKTKVGLLNRQVVNHADEFINNKEKKAVFNISEPGNHCAGQASTLLKRGGGAAFLKEAEKLQTSHKNLGELLFNTDNQFPDQVHETAEKISEQIIAANYRLQQLHDILNKTNAHNPSMRTNAEFASVSKKWHKLKVDILNPKKNESEIDFLKEANDLLKDMYNKVTNGAVFAVKDLEGSLKIADEVFVLLSNKLPEGQNKAINQEAGINQIKFESVQHPTLEEIKTEGRNISHHYLRDESNYQIYRYNNNVYAICNDTFVLLWRKGKEHSNDSQDLNLGKGGRGVVKGKASNSYKAIKMQRSDMGEFHKNPNHVTIDSLKQINEKLLEAKFILDSEKISDHFVIGLWNIKSGFAEESEFIMPKINTSKYSATTESELNFLNALYTFNQRGLFHPDLLHLNLPPKLGKRYMGEPGVTENSGNILTDQYNRKVAIDIDDNPFASGHLYNNYPAKDQWLLYSNRKNPEAIKKIVEYYQNSEAKPLSENIEALKSMVENGHINIPDSIYIKILENGEKSKGLNSQIQTDLKNNSPDNSFIIKDFLSSEKPSDIPESIEEGKIKEITDIIKNNKLGNLERFKGANKKDGFKYEEYFIKRERYVPDFSIEAEEIQNDGQNDPNIKASSFYVPVLYQLKHDDDDYVIYPFLINYYCLDNNGDSLRKIACQKQRIVVEKLIDNMQILHGFGYIHGDPTATKDSSNFMFNPETLDVKFIDTTYPQCLNDSTIKLKEKTHEFKIMFREVLSKFLNINSSELKNIEKRIDEISTEEQYQVTINAIKSAIIEKDGTLQFDTLAMLSQ